MENRIRPRSHTGYRPRSQVQIPGNNQAKHHCRRQFTSPILFLPPRLKHLYEIKKKFSFFSKFRIRLGKIWLCCRPIKNKEEGLLAGLEKERNQEKIYFFSEKVEKIYLENQKRDLLIISIYLEVYFFFLQKEKIYLSEKTAYIFRCLPVHALPVLRYEFPDILPGADARELVAVVVPGLMENKGVNASPA